MTVTADFPKAAHFELKDANFLFERCRICSIQLLMTGLSLVLKLVTLSAQSVKKRTQFPENSENATGSALIANVTLGNDF